MKKMILIVTLFVTGFMAGQETLPAKIQVPYWWWIDIEGTDGDSCGLEKGDWIIYAGDFDKKHIVCIVGPKEPTLGTPCNGGEVFVIERVLYMAWIDKYDMVIQRQNKRKSKIAKILTKKQ